MCLLHFLQPGYPQWEHAQTPYWDPLVVRLEFCYWLLPVPFSLLSQPVAATTLANVPNLIIYQHYVFLPQLI